MKTTVPRLEAPGRFPALPWNRRPARIRMQLQSEPSECGLACLAMLAQTCGMRITVCEMRHRFKISSRGMRLATLISVARELGLKVRAVQADFASIALLQHPCILFWEGDHYVVYGGVSYSKFTLYDPAIGKRIVSSEQMRVGFSGIAVELVSCRSVEDQFVNRAAPRMRFSELTGDVPWRAITAVLLASCCYELCVLVVPRILQYAVDGATSAHVELSIPTLALTFASVAAAAALAYSWKGLAIVKLTNTLSKSASLGLFKKITEIELDYFRRNYTGSVISRFASFRSIQQILSEKTIQTCLDVFLVIGVVSVLFIYSIPLGLLTCACCAAAFALRFSVASNARYTLAEKSSISGLQTNQLAEVIRGAEALRLFRSEATRTTRWKSLVDRQFQCDYRIGKSDALGAGTSSFILQLDRIAVVVVYVSASSTNIAAIGSMVAYLAYREILVSRVSSLCDLLMQIRIVQVHADRVHDVLAHPSEDQELTENSLYCLQNCPHAAKESRNCIVLKGVSFRHSDYDEFIVSDLSFCIRRGEWLAICGPSGVGKTTVLKLVLSLLKPTDGSIQFSDCSVSTLAEYRNQFSSVLQSDTLFSGSLIDNITSFSEEVDMAYVRQCADLACIAEDIDVLPLKYETKIVNPVSDFSGGQKQRILLARALYSNRQILVLDEATSHLDSATEARINASLRSLGKTVVFVAHRQETLAMADRTISLRLPESHSVTRHPAAPADSARRRGIVC